MRELDTETLAMIERLRAKLGSAKADELKTHLEQERHPNKLSWFLELNEFMKRDGLRRTGLPAGITL